jgi:hypothetical protein
MSSQSPKELINEAFNYDHGYSNNSHSAPNSVKQNYKLVV